VKSFENWTNLGATSQVRANDPGMQDLHLECDIQQRMALLEEAESHWACGDGEMAMDAMDAMDRGMSIWI